MDAHSVVFDFWLKMKTNKFRLAAELLAEEYVCYWPMSNEVIRGRENFIAINELYPAEGIWRFDVQDIIAEGERVVSDVVISDGKTNARVISFHTVVNGKIVQQKEFWPEQYQPPQWRRKYTDLYTGFDPFR